MLKPNNGELEWNLVEISGVENIKPTSTSQVPTESKPKEEKSTVLPQEPLVPVQKVEPVQIVEVPNESKPIETNQTVDVTSVPQPIESKPIKKPVARTVLKITQPLQDKYEFNVGDNAK